MTVPRWVPLALLGVVLLVAAAGLLFSTFMMYDDEGYVLFSLQSFVDGGGLYERVYSQYGPFFYLYHQVLHGLGLAFTNNGARLITLLNWLATAGFCGAIAWRHTRSAAATAFAAGGVFLHLWTLISEPSHPGGFIVMSLSLLAWLGTIWAARPGRLAIAAGLVGGALLLTKINVGVFVLAGAGAWWAMHLDASPRIRRALLAAVIAALGAMPFALMRNRLGLDWVAAFATISATSAVGTALVASRGAQPLTRWSDLARAAAAALVVVMITGASILAQHTSWPGLLEGVLLGPLRFPLAYTHPVVWRTGALPLALGSLALAVVAVVRPRLVSWHVIALLRVAILAVFFLAWLFTWSLNTHAFALSYALASTWLYLAPLDAAAQPARPARAWLALLLVPQALHAFPVAGSQISWGTFLWIPLAVVGAHEALRAGARRWWPHRPQLLAAAAALVLVVTIGRCAQYAWVGVTRLRQSDALGLPGTSLLRVPESFATAMRVLTLNAQAHADVLFSLPGMLSFHRWTGVPPPTTQNATHWFTLLSPAQQDAIQQKLAASPRSCVIVQRRIYQFLVDTHVATESPLSVWLQANYEPVFSVDSYEFLVRKGRRVAPLGTATVREAAAGVTPRYLISLTLAAPAEDIAAIELRHFVGDTGRKATTWSAPNAQFAVTPLNSSGAEMVPPRSVSLPYRASGLVRLDVFTDVFPATAGYEFAAIYVLNRAGERVAEARLLP